MPPNSTKTIAFNYAAGSYGSYCSIPGHRQSGMFGSIGVALSGAHYLGEGTNLSGPAPLHFGTCPITHGDSTLRDLP